MSKAPITSRRADIVRLFCYVFCQGKVTIYLIKKTCQLLYTLSRKLVSYCIPYQENLLVTPLQENLLDTPHQGKLVSYCITYQENLLVTVYLYKKTCQLLYTSSRKFVIYCITLSRKLVSYCIPDQENLLVTVYLYKKTCWLLYTSSRKPVSNCIP